MTTNLNNIVYINCDRKTATIKSDGNTNVWETSLLEGLKIPSGTRLEIVNSFINYRGLSGGSIEIEEDIQTTISLVYYISHTPFLVPKPVDATTATTVSEQIAVDCFQQINPNVLLANQGAFSAQGLTNLGNGTWGYSEQPLFACQVDANGYITPILNTIIIKIPKGIYGLQQLSNVIQSQMNGDVNDISAPGSVFDGNMFTGNFFGNLDNKRTLILSKSFPYTINGDTTPNAIRNLTAAQANTYTEGGNRHLFVTAAEFNNMFQYLKIHGNLTNPQFAWATIRTTWFFGIIRNWIDNEATPNGQEANLNYTYRPLFDGFYLGTSDLNFSYDITNSGFSFEFLHSPRRIPSYDAWGNQTTGAGQVCIFLRKPTTYQFAQDFGTLPAQDSRYMYSALSTPSSRNSGICVINWGFEVCYSEQHIFTEDMENTAYFGFNDFFREQSAARLAWMKTLWYRLGFDFDQMANPLYYETSRFYNNINGTRLLGTTTNNKLTSDTQNTIASMFDPLTRAKADDMGHAITNEVQFYDLLNTNRPVFGILGFEWPNRPQDFRMFKYMSSPGFTAQYPIITTSVELLAKNLPILSTQGYFLICSDIIDGFLDVLKTKQTLPILGITPKSNLSNQDFIASFSDIYHIFNQDKVIQRFKIEILNPDLTAPMLGEYSSLVLKFTMPYAQPQPIEQQKDEKK